MTNPVHPFDQLEELTYQDFQHQNFLNYFSFVSMRQPYPLSFYHYLWNCELFQLDNYAILQIQLLLSGVTRVSKSAEKTSFLWFFSMSITHISQMIFSNLTFFVWKFQETSSENGYHLGKRHSKLKNQMCLKYRKRRSSTGKYKKKNWFLHWVLVGFRRKKNKEVCNQWVRAVWTCKTVVVSGKEPKIIILKGHSRTFQTPQHVLPFVIILFVDVQPRQNWFIERIHTKVH